MYALLSDSAKKRTTQQRLERTYKQAAETLTLEKVRAGPVTDDTTVPIVLETRIFGTLRGNLVIPTGDRKDAGPGVDWRAELVYPGLRRGEKLRRETSLPPRAAIEARDGTPLAKGPDRVSDLGPIASDLAGTIGPAAETRTAELEARGVPAGAAVGLTGLEREFDERLTGTPGGVLLAGKRVLANVKPKPGSAVRTTIDPKIQQAAVDALAGRYGGIAVVRPANAQGDLPRRPP